MLVSCQIYYIITYFQLINAYRLEELDLIIKNTLMG